MRNEARIQQQLGQIVGAIVGAVVVLEWGWNGIAVFVSGYLLNIVWLLAYPRIRARLGWCSRCRRRIRGFRPPDEVMTAGYYVAAAWRKYANPGEVYICDACMWSDPAYIVDYGHGPQ